jgi:hypothetical protein
MTARERGHHPGGCRRSSPGSGALSATAPLAAQTAAATIGLGGTSTAGTYTATIVHSVA